MTSVGWGRDSVKNEQREEELMDTDYSVVTATEEMKEVLRG